MTVSIFSDGKEFISASRAAKEFGYARDYIGQLCREKKIPGKLVGRTWYVELDALTRYASSFDTHEKKIDLHQDEIVPTKNHKLAFKYSEDNRPRLPELSKKTNTFNQIEKSRQAHPVFVPSLFLILGLSLSLLATGKTAPLSTIGEKLASFDEQVGEIFSPEQLTYVTANVIGSGIEKFFDGVVLGFDKLKEFAARKIFLTSNTSSTPAPLAPTTPEPKVAETKPVVTRVANTVTPNLSSIRDEIRRELENYVDLRISSINSPTIIYNSTPNVILPSAFETFKRNEVIPITYNVVTRQSDSDSGSWSRAVTALIEGQSSFNRLCIGSDCRTSWPSGGGGGSASYFGDLGDVSTSSDATGDIYYLNSSGQIVNLGAGADGEVLKLSSGIPSWDSDLQGSGAFAWTPTSWGVSTSTTLGFLNGFLSTASSTIDGNLRITGNSTTTNATTTAFYATTASTTNFAIGGGTLSIFGTSGTTLSAFCTAITGSADLCDGSDATSAGGGTFAWTPTSWGVSTSTTLGFLNGFLSTASSTIDSNLIITGNSTTTNATTTNFYSTTASSTNLYSSVATIGGTALTVNSSGQVSVGNVTPLTNFNVTHTAGTANGIALIGSGASGQSARLFFHSTVDSGNGFSILKGAGTGANAFLSFNYNATPGSSTGSVGIAMLDDGNVGFGGTTTPQHVITSFSSSAPQLSLSSGAGIAQWAFRNAGGDLFLATTTVAGTATTSISALEIAGSGFGTTTLRGLNISGQATSTSNVGYNITSGCYAIGGTCVSGGSGSGDPFAWTPTSWGVSTSTTLGFLNGFLSTASSTVDANLYVTGSLGVATGTPGAKLAVENTGTGAGLIVSDQANDTSPFIIDSSGNVGIGTATPGDPLHVRATTNSRIMVDNTGSNGLSEIIFNDWTGSTVGTIGQYDGSQNYSSMGLALSTGAHDITFLTNNAGGYTGTTRMVIKQGTGHVGIGTSTPLNLLTLATTTAPQLSLSSGAGLAQWAFRNAGGNLYLATTTVAGTATTSTAALSIDGTSGTTTVWALNATATGANATSTIEGNLHVKNTLQIGGSSIYITGSGITNTESSNFNISSNLTITGNSTTTNATTTAFYATTASTTNFAIGGGTLSIFGTSGTALSDFCTAITGGAGLCDGDDATGTAGGFDFSYSQDLGYGLTGSATSTITKFSAGLLASSTSYFSNASTTLLSILDGLWVGTSRWDNGSGKIDGEQIADDTIDDDSIDFADVTLADLTFDVGSVDTTEFGYLNGVTSAIQTQLDAKVANTRALTVAGTANQITSSAGAQDLSADRTWTLSIPTDFRVSSTTISNLLVSNGSIFDTSTTTSATSTNSFATTASSTNLYTTNFTFGGVTGNSWDDFCVSITGGAGLCDGDDATGTAGGFDFSYSQDLGYGLTGSATSTITKFSAGLLASSTSYFSNATATNLTVLENFWVGNNSLVVNSSGDVGIGTTTPQWLLNPQSSTEAQLSLSAGAGFAQWAFRNAGGNLYLATTTVAGTATTTTSALTIIGSNGNLGVGSTTPFAKLSIHAAEGEVSDTLFAIGSSTASTISSLFSVSNTGLTTIGNSAGTGDATFQFAGDSNAWAVGYNSVDKSFNIASSTNFSSNVALTITKGSSLQLGVGSTSPWRTFTVAGTVGFDGLTTNTGGVTSALCLDSNKQVTQNTDNETCVASSARYKQNIETIDSGSALTLLKELRPVSFEFKTATGTTHYGFIAEEVEAISKLLVSYDKEGLPQSVRYIEIIPLIVQAIQELSTNAFSQSVTWFADATNGIGDFFANRVRTKEICVSDNEGFETCLDKAKLDALIHGATGTYTVSSPTPTPPPPASTSTPSTSTGSASSTPTTTSTSTPSVATTTPSTTSSSTPPVTPPPPPPPPAPVSTSTPTATAPPAVTSSTTSPVISEE